MTSSSSPSSSVGWVEETSEKRNYSGVKRGKKKGFMPSESLKDIIINIIIIIIKNIY